MTQLKSLFYTFSLIALAGSLMQCKSKAPTETTADKTLDSRIIETETSDVCEVFTVENPDRAKISQNFADMNLRRQAGDYGPGEYSAYDYWKKVYSKAPGLSILVYTDGSAIFREMAKEAKENEEEQKYQEYVQQAFALLEQGEKCFPETAGRFGPSKAYILELTQPGEYQQILDFYTEGLGPDTDPYSLISIARYASYMGYINEMPKADADALVAKVRGYATAKAGERDFDYAVEEVDAIKKQYVDLYAEKEAKAEKQEAAQQGSTNKEGATAYDKMIKAVEAGDLATAHTEFLKYAENEEDATRKYKTAMYIGGTHYGAEDNVKAREAYRIAMNADPSMGDPYYFVGLMYLSSGPQCGPGTGFDSQRVVWVGFDKLNVALDKTLELATTDEINNLKADYQDFMPSAAQITEKGLSKGDTYTVPCWINEQTTVRPSGL